MDQIYDVIIIGGGAAATSAAMTLKNRGKTFAVVANKAETGSLYKAEKITNYPGLDPETASTTNFSGAGLDWGSYPTMKKVVLGVNITF